MSHIRRCCHCISAQMFLLWHRSHLLKTHSQTKTHAQANKRLLSLSLYLLQYVIKTHCWQKEWIISVAHSADGVKGLKPLLLSGPPTRSRRGLARPGLIYMRVIFTCATPPTRSLSSFHSYIKNHTKDYSIYHFRGSALCISWLID